MPIRDFINRKLNLAACPINCVHGLKSSAVFRILGNSAPALKCLWRTLDVRKPLAPLPFSFTFDPCVKMTARCVVPRCHGEISCDVRPCSSNLSLVALPCSHGAFEALTKLEADVRLGRVNATICFICKIFMPVYFFFKVCSLLMAQT